MIARPKQVHGIAQGAGAFAPVLEPGRGLGGAKRQPRPPQRLRHRRVALQRMQARQGGAGQKHRVVGRIGRCSGQPVRQAGRQGRKVCRMGGRRVVSRNWWKLAGGVICRWTLTHPTGGGNAREITP